jgi:murein DD-endopeptidase MepM/ murein hydrolase activator NlpD
VGVGDQPLWEVQWHSGGGGRVRRLVLTRRGGRVLTAALGLALVLLLAIVGILPIGLRGVLERITVRAMRRENRGLRAEQVVLRERAMVAADAIHAQLHRARRLAWVVAVPEQEWQSGVPADRPVPAVLNDDLVAWLEARCDELMRFADELSVPARELPCPLPALPTGAPLDMRRAVPVATYGWWTSPFTGKRDASHGVLLAASAGEPVLAPGAGRVAWAGSVRERRANEWTRFGTLVILDHGGGAWTVFGHLRDVVVRRGQRVVRGERIATVGSSGWTRVPALYYEVRWPIAGESVPVDPALFNLVLPLPELAACLADPHGDLSGDWAKLEHLRLAR